MNTFKPTLRQRARLLLTQPRLAIAAAVPAFTYYGGATVTRAHDATGALFTVACCKANDTGVFGLYVIKGNAPILIAPVSGRGSVWVSLYDGKASWVGFDGSVPPAGGLIPGFVPFVGLASLQAQIADCRLQLATMQQQLVGLPPTIANGVLRVPAQDSAHQGGEIQLMTSDGSPPVCIDLYDRVFRIHRDGVVLERWPK